MSMKSASKILLLICLFVVYTNFVIAFDGKDLVLIHGKVTDYDTNNPLGITIIFFSQSGKQIHAKSNSTDGSFQQVLQAGEKYNIVFKDFILINDNPELEVPKSGKYSEIEKNFTVKKIETGLGICSFNPFKPNNYDLTSNYFSCINELKSFLDNNPKVNVIITIHTYDSNPQPIEKKVTYLDSKNRKKTKKVKVSTAEQLQELAENRLNALKNLIKSANIIERKVTYEIDTKTSASMEKQTSSKKSSKTKSKTQTQTFSQPTVYIKVGKILNL